MKDKRRHTQNSNQGYFLPLYTWMPKDFCKKEKEKEWIIESLSCYDKIDGCF